MIRPHIQPRLKAAHIAPGNRQREDDSGLQKLFVVRKIPCVFDIPRQIQPNMFRNLLLQAYFVNVLPLRRHGPVLQARNKYSSLRRRCQQQILNRWSLEHPVVGSAQYRTRLFYVVSHPDSWARGRVLRQQAVLVEPQSQVQREMPNANTVLSKSSNLPAIALVEKMKRIVDGKLRRRVGGIVENLVAGCRQRKVLPQPQPMPLRSELERMPSPLVADAGVQAFCLGAVMQAHKVWRARQVWIQQASNAGAAVH